MMKATKLVVSMALAGIVVSSTAASASAWNRSHPARTEINDRIRTQDTRIINERRDGQITAAQAHALRSNDRSIRAQERADARADDNHGHLTGAQVRDLNGDLNANSRSIGH